MAATQDDVMRLVAEVVDKYSVPLKDMKKAVDAVAKSGGAANALAAAKAKEHAKQVKELQERYAKMRETAVELVTPALASIGIAGLGAAEAVKSLIEASRSFGDLGRTFEIVQNRSGMSAGKIRELDEAASQAGISVEEMNQGLSNMGEFLDQTQKHFPQALAKWNELPLAYQRIGKSLAEMPRDKAFDAVLDFLPQMGDKAQKRQLLGILGLPENWADLTKETIDEIRASAREFAKSPFDEEAARRANKAWREMGSTFREVRQELEGMVAPEVTKGIETLRGFLQDTNATKSIADAISHNVDDIKQIYADIKSLLETTGIGRILTQPFGKTLDELHQNAMKPSDTPPGQKQFNFRDAIKGGPLERFFKSNTSFTGGFGEGGLMPVAFSRSDAGNILSDSVKEGMLAAFREWAADQEIGGDGFQKASYEPGGGSGFRFGNSRYPLLSVSRGDVPAGSGPDAAGIPRGARDVAKIVRDEWHRAGMSDEGIAGLMANIQDESRFNPTLRHPDQPNYGGEAHFAHGLYQEGGAEWNNYAAWLQKNYPGSDWRDPRMQSRFAAWNLKTNYHGVWESMAHSDRFHAAAEYVNGYLKPAAAYRFGRMRKYLGGGVAGLEAYTGPMGDHASLDHLGASLRDHIRNKAVRNALKTSMLTPGAGVDLDGHARVTVDFQNMPRGIRTAARTEGIFKEVKLNRGRAMPMASMES